VYISNIALSSASSKQPIHNLCKLSPSHPKMSPSNEGKNAFAEPQDASPNKGSLKSGKETTRTGPAATSNVTLLTVESGRPTTSQGTMRPSSVITQAASASAGTGTSVTPNCSDWPVFIVPIQFGRDMGVFVYRPAKGLNVSQRGTQPPWRCYRSRTNIGVGVTH
jgi:hypothetical protein